MSKPGSLFSASGFQKWFGISAGVILIITGVAKLFSITGHTRLLAVTDPVFGMTFGRLMLMTGLLEAAIGLFCLLSKKLSIALALVAWLAASFLVYRLGLSLVGWRQPCACLGTLTDTLGLSSKLADSIMKMLAIYLFFGSYMLLLGRRLQQEPLPESGLIK